MAIFLDFCSTETCLLRTEIIQWKLIIRLFLVSYTIPLIYAKLARKDV